MTTVNFDHDLDIALKHLEILSHNNDVKISMQDITLISKLLMITTSTIIRALNVLVARGLWETHFEDANGQPIDQSELSDIFDKGFCFKQLKSVQVFWVAKSNSYPDKEITSEISFNKAS